MNDLLTRIDTAADTAELDTLAREVEALYDAIKDRRRTLGKRLVAALRAGDRVATTDGLRGIPAGVTATVVGTARTRVSVRFDADQPSVREYGSAPVKVPAACLVPAE